MARLADTSFTAWELTEREQLEGSTLNHFQKMLLQTDLAAVAEQILALTMDVSKPLEHLAKHAELTGQKLVLQTILDRSEAAQVLLQEKAQNPNSQE